MVVADYRPNVSKKQHRTATDLCLLHTTVSAVSNQYLTQNYAYDYGELMGIRGHGLDGCRSGTCKRIGHVSNSLWGKQTDEQSPSCKPGVNNTLSYSALICFSSSARLLCSLTSCLSSLDQPTISSLPIDHFTINILHTLCAFSLCSLIILWSLFPSYLLLSCSLLNPCILPQPPSLMYPADIMKEVYYNHHSHHPFPSEYPHFSSL